MEDPHICTKRGDTETWSDRQAVKGHRDGSSQAFSIFRNIILILPVLPTFVLGVLAVYLKEKPVVLHPLGNILIQATQVVRRALNIAKEKASQMAFHLSIHHLEVFGYFAALIDNPMA